MEENFARISFFVILLYFFNISKSYGYAWARGRNNVYIEYNFVQEQKYDSFFEFFINNDSKLSFQNFTSKTLFIDYMEYGLSDKHTIIRKTTAEYITGLIKIKNHVSEVEKNVSPLKKEDQYYVLSNLKSWNKKNTPLKRYSEKIILSNTSEEIGLRTLLKSDNNYKLSSEITLLLPNNFDSSFRTKLGISCSYHNIYLSVPYFLEFMVSIVPHKKKHEVLSAIIAGINFYKNFSITYSMHTSFLNSDSFQEIVYKKKYKTVASKYFDQKNLTLDEGAPKKLNTKLNLKLAYRLNNSTELSISSGLNIDNFISPYQTSKKLYSISFSLIRYRFSDIV